MSELTIPNIALKVHIFFYYFLPIFREGKPLKRTVWGVGDFHHHDFFSREFYEQFLGINFTEFALKMIIQLFVLFFPI